MIFLSIFTLLRGTADNCQFSHHFNDFCILLDFEDDEDFGFILPSLIRQLKNILNQYPDNDQIIKVSSNFYPCGCERQGRCYMWAQ